MTQTSSFFEQFDRSYTQRNRRRPPTSVISVAVLALLFVVAIGVATFVVVDRDEPTVEEILDAALQAHVDGRLIDAADGYREVLFVDPGNKYAHYNLGLIAQVEGRPDEAEKAYRAALDGDPQYVPALYNLGILRYDDADYVEAVELYRSVLAVDPDHARAHLNLGFALRALGRRAEGAEEIGRAVELDPTLVTSVPAATDDAGAGG